MDGNAALAGQGIAILNAALWWHEIGSGRLVQVHPHTAFSRVRYWLVYPEYKRLQPKIVAFRDWLIEEMTRAAQAGPAEAFRPG